MKTRWTKWLVLSFVLTFVLPAAGHAHEMEKWEGCFAKLQRFHYPTHQKMYLQLLVDKYTPQSAADWKAAFAVRDKLVKEWEALEPNEEAKTFHKQLHEQRSELKKKWEAGEISREEMHAQLREWKKAHWKGSQGKEHGKKHDLFQKYRAVNEEFDQAVEANNPTQLKQVLPKLLEEVQAMNQYYETRLQAEKAKK